MTISRTNASLAGDARDMVEYIIERIADTEQPPEERGAWWAIGQQLRLKLDRGLKASRDDLISHMDRNSMKSMGPLSIKSTAVDPSYPCNAPENHLDATVQDAMAQMLGNRDTRPYIRQVPSHLEIAVDVLAADVQMGVQAAIDLYRDLNKKGWRREEARRLSLAVRETKRGIDV